MVIERIKQVADGKLTSKQIAEIVGSTPKYVQRQMLAHDLPRLQQRLPMYGAANKAWVGGRAIDLGGYALVNAPESHPLARRGGSIYEHRIVMEKTLGRFLSRQEVVDHIDGVTIHNHPDNLRLFASNRDHMKATISGQIPSWSEEGRNKLRVYRQQKDLPVVDKHRLNKERGDVRLRTILRAWLLLDRDSPYLCGTRHWLEKSGIDDFSHSNLELRLRDVLQRMA